MTKRREAGCASTLPVPSCSGLPPQPVSSMPKPKRRAELASACSPQQIDRLLSGQEIEMRTSLMDILRLAWALWRHPERRAMRIGQMICNSHRSAHSRLSQPPLFYVENQDLLKNIKQSHDVLYWSRK